MSIDTNSHTSGLQASAPAFGRPQVSPPQPLGIKGNWADNWKIWKQGWDNYGIIAGLNSQLEDYKCTILLHSIGIEAMRIYNGMKFSTAKYVQHFCGQTQEFFERFQFNHRDQAFGKSIDVYLSVLWNMAKNCGFCDCMRDLLIMDHFLLGISDTRKSCSLLIYFWTKQLKSFKHWKLLPITRRPWSVRKLRRSRIYWRRQKSYLDKHQKLNLENQESWNQEISPRRWSEIFKEEISILPSNSCVKKRKAPCLGKNLCSLWWKKSLQSLWEVWTPRCQLSCWWLLLWLIWKQLWDNQHYNSSWRLSLQFSKHWHPTYFLQNGYHKACQNPNWLQGHSLHSSKALPGGSAHSSRRVHLQIWIKTSLPALGKCKVKVKNPTIKKEYKVDFVIVGNHHTPLFSSVAAQKMDLISVHYDKLKAVIIQY